MATKTPSTTDARSRPLGHAGDRDGGPATAKRLVEAVAARDYKGIFGTLAPDARLRYLIPPGPGEVVGAAEVAAKFFEWFGDVDVIRAESVSVESLGDRISARYCFVLHEQEGREVVQQQTYLDVDAEGRIVAIDLLCSGFRPSAAPEAPRSSGVHRFDAGDLGCADGLAQEFRRRILAIPTGDVLVVETKDPAANQDLPPLARMMGHTVRSIESPGDGRLLITVERGR